MKNLLFVFILSLLSLCRLMAQTAVAPSAGDGTSGNPYQVASWENLYWISQNQSSWNMHFIQTQDIDFSTATPAISTWNSNKGWPGIANGGTPFTGTYNGQNHSISGLYASTTNTGYIGLFGAISYSTIKNIVVENVDFTSYMMVGGIVGRVFSNSTIENCHSSGNIISNGSNIGGIAGYVDQATIIGCTSSCNISYYNNVGTEFGGLVGQALYSTLIENCGATGNVTANYNGGGLIGKLTLSTVRNSYAKGNVYCGLYYAAGFISTVQSSTISNCYALGSATSSYKTSAGFIQDITGT